MNIDPSKVNLSEKDIEDWLFDNPKELGIEKWIGRQFDVPSGRIDLLGIWETNFVGISIPVVVEVKNVTVDSFALTQVCRYAKDIEEILITRDEWMEREEKPWVRKIVVGKESVDNRIMFEAYALNVDIHTFSVQFKLDISGEYKWSSEARVEQNLRYREIAKLEIFDNLIALPEEPEHLEEGGEE